MHEVMRMLGWITVVVLSIGVWFPFGALRRLPTARRVQLVVGILVLAAGGLLHKRAKRGTVADA